MYKINMDGNNPTFSKLSDSEQKKVKNRQRRSVTLDISKTMLQELKRYSGIKNDVSDRAIVLAAITKAIGNQ